jgi:hypothetical protein
MVCHPARAASTASPFEDQRDVHRGARQVVALAQREEALFELTRVRRAATAGRYHGS